MGKVNRTINESQLSNIIAKSIKKTLNEISQGLINRAFYASRDKVNPSDTGAQTDIMNVYTEAYDAVENLRDWIEDFNNKEVLGLADDILSILEKIKVFLERKSNQYDFFEKNFDYEHENEY